jgi:hypothetical protein
MGSGFPSPAPTKSLCLDLSQISMLGLISENRLLRNQPLTASKKLINSNLRQIPVPLSFAVIRCEQAESAEATTMARLFLVSAVALSMLAVENMSMAKILHAV